MEEEMSAGEQLRHITRPFYNDLLCKIAASSPPEQKLTGFSTIVGSQYEKSDSRLLVYGRAVDGWRYDWLSNSPVEESLTNIFKIPEADKIAKCEMNWILRNFENWSTAKTDSKDKFYNYKYSSFWCGARDVIKTLEDKSVLTESEWPSHMAWSNVYKISPSTGGNPPKELRSVQISHCIQIIRAEIEHLKPRRILFITGGWGAKILDSINVKPNKFDNKIVQYAGKVDFAYGTAKVVVTVRPERQKRDIWTKEVVSAFTELGNNI